MDALLDNAFVRDVVVLARPALFNLYFAAASIPFGFPFAVALAAARVWGPWPLARLAGTYVYAFRGSPLFIQFFMFYSVLLAFNREVWKPLGIDHVVLHPLFIGPLVLVLNTAAYAGEIFTGALRSVPRGQVEAARAIGMSPWQTFRQVTWPNALRLAWPAYSNEVVFLFQATALVYFTLPVIGQQKDLMNKAGELFERDYDLFLHYGVAALYFLAISMVLFRLFAWVNARLNAHLEPERRAALKLRPQYVR